jgi:hypothetical protein
MIYIEMCMNMSFNLPLYPWINISTLADQSGPHISCYIRKPPLYQVLQLQHWKWTMLRTDVDRQEVTRDMEKTEFYTLQSHEHD